MIMALNMMIETMSDEPLALSVETKQSVARQEKVSFNRKLRPKLGKYALNFIPEP